MLRIPNLDLVGVELLERLRSRGRTHPVQSLQTCPHGCLDVDDQRFDLGFRSGREVFGRVELAHTEAQIAPAVPAITGTFTTRHGLDGTFPAYGLLRLSRECLVAELVAGIA